MKSGGIGLACGVDVSEGEKGSEQTYDSPGGVQGPTPGASGRASPTLSRSKGAGEANRAAIPHTAAGRCRTV
jgi:hypothetical protein